MCKLARFYQAPGGRPGGAGLGLAIAKDIVDEHGGAIGVESEPGKGSSLLVSPSCVGRGDEQSQSLKEVV